MRFWQWGIVLFTLFAISIYANPLHDGVLRVCQENPRYFTNDSGRPIYLTGSHTWANMHERGVPGLTPDFDFAGYLHDLEQWGHNFIRLWAWEQATWMQFCERAFRIRYTPLRYERTGPGLAVDGKLKFDVRQWNEEYFQRLKQRVKRAGERGFYVGVMLFQGFSIEQKGTDGVDPKKGNPWDGHPFNAKNNINGIDGDLNDNGEGEEIHQLQNERITRLQERFVKKAIDTLNEFDHIIWEITNESSGDSIPWQYHLIDVIQKYEQSKPKQHPVWISYAWPGCEDADLFNSRAEAVSPKEGYKTDPPAATGEKVILADSDHIEPWNTDPQWVWKCFLRGLNPIIMDAYKDVRYHQPREPVEAWGRIRRAMGYTRQLARRISLAEMVPANELASTTYCLADVGREYLVYQPQRGQAFTVNLPEAYYACSWYDAATGEAMQQKFIKAGGDKQTFSPAGSTDFLVHIKRNSE